LWVKTLATPLPGILLLTHSLFLARVNYACKAACRCLYLYLYTPSLRLRLFHCGLVATNQTWPRPLYRNGGCPAASAYTALNKFSITFLGGGLLLRVLRSVIVTVSSAIFPTFSGNRRWSTCSSTLNKVLNCGKANILLKNFCFTPLAGVARTLRPWQKVYT